MQPDNVVLELPCCDREGESVYQVRMLREFDRVYDLSPQKIADLWREFKDHKALFSDYTEGKFLPFFVVLMDPRGVWMEIVKKGEERPRGVAYVTGVKPNHEADGHFALWDRMGSGRGPLILFLTEWIADRYNLHRVNAYVPQYQRGVMRFIERMGFVREGVKREAVAFRGVRVPLHIFGITRNEIEDQISAIW